MKMERKRLVVTLLGSVFVFVSWHGEVCAGVVEDWNDAFLQAVRKEAPPPCLVSRNLPIMHLAMHRAAQSAVQAGLEQRDIERAICAAGEKVFFTFFPSQSEQADAVRAKLDFGNQSLVVGEPKWLVLGNKAVKSTLEERVNDGSSTTVHYVPSDEPGQWRRTPPKFRPPEFPHWGKVKPFVLKSADQFRPPPPPSLENEDYAKQLKEVRVLGGKDSKARTDEQTLIARFWSDFSYTTSPAGHWNDIARYLTMKNEMGDVESARLFAVLNVTLADACIAIWDCKYHYNFWRPVTAVRRANEDESDGAQVGDQWDSLLPAPPHPEYVSGHSGISGAAATVLAHFFKDDKISFEVESDDVKGVKRQFTSFWDCAEEVSRSRVFGGIHYTISGQEGLKLGRKVANYVLERPLE